MNRWRLELLLLSATLVACAMATHRWRQLDVGPATGHAIPALTRTPMPAFTRSALRAAAETTVANDPFRLSNSPPDVDASMRSNAGKPSPARAPHPTLVLKAITGGPPWQAIVAGIPGQPGDALVAPGGAYGTLTVQSITRDAVVVRAPDTTWTLSLKRSAP